MGGIFERLRGAFLAHQGGERPGQRMAWIDFEHALLPGDRLLVLAQQAFEMHIDIALIGHQAHRAFGQA